MAAKTATRTQQVYGALRSDILAGRREPGARLPLGELSDCYGSALSAVREALQRLSAQGLVVAEPQHGFRVASISKQDLLDLTEARIEFEGLALKMAIEHGGVDWEVEVVAALHKLRRTPVVVPDSSPPTLSTEWADAHLRFHEALISGCPNQRIRATADSLRDAAELYRQWSWIERQERDTVSEHETLAEAALNRQTQAALTLFTEHLEATANGLVSQRDQWRDQ